MGERFRNTKFSGKAGSSQVNHHALAIDLVLSGSIGEYFQADEMYLLAAELLLSGASRRTQSILREIKRNYPDYHPEDRNLGPWREVDYEKRIGEDPLFAIKESVNKRVRKTLWNIWDNI